METKQKNQRHAPGKKTIFLFLGNRLHITDALRTRFLGELARRHRVHIFLPTEIGGVRPDISAYPKGENISYHYIPAPRGKFWTLFHELRSELVTEFDHTIGVKLRRRYKQKNFRQRILGGVASFLPTGALSTDFFTKLESRTAPGYENFRAYTEKYNPDLVFVRSTCVSLLEVYAILWARRAKIPSVAHPSWDNLVVHTRYIRKPDYLVVWNEQNRQESIGWHGYPPERVFLGGVLRFDHYFRDDPLPETRETFLRKRGLDPNKKTILFAAALHGTFYKDFIRAFLSWRKERAFPEDVNLFVRIHVLDPIDAYREFFGIPGVYLERGGKSMQSDLQSGHKAEMDEEDLVNMKMTLAYTDICVTLTSTMSGEAMVFDTPVVCAGFVPGYSEALQCESYRPLVECGASRVAASLQEMRGLIAEYLKDPARDKGNRKEGVRHVMGPTDGYSYKRYADCIDAILAREEEKQGQ